MTEKQEYTVGRVETDAEKVRAAILGFEAIQDLAHSDVDAVQAGRMLERIALVAGDYVNIMKDGLEPTRVNVHLLRAPRGEEGDETR